MAKLMCVLIAMFFSMALGRSAMAQGLPTVELSRVGDATHLEFKGQSDWKYDIKKIKSKDGNKVILRLPPLAPETLTLLRGHSDSLIKSIEVNPSGVDDANELIFNVANSEVDSFDYTSDQPSRLIIDFFIKDEAEAPKAEVPKTEAPKVESPVSEKMAGAKAENPTTPMPTSLPKKETSSEKNRKPASDFMTVPANQPLPPMPGAANSGSDGKEMAQGIFDGGDPQFRRFSIQDFEVKESAIIATRRNLYIEFPMLVIDSPHLKALIENPPLYEIIPGETDENKEAQLLLVLQKNKRTAIFLKTAKEFLEKYPNTQYEEIIRYMIADQHYDFWLKEKNPNDFATAMGQYLALSEKYPDSPLAMRTSLLMAYSYVERGDSFAALKAFQRVLRKNNDPRLADRIKISMAEAYQRLSKYDDALALLDDVEKTAGNPKDSTEASYRKGDIYFVRREFGEAIKRYRNALRKYPLAWRDFPNAYYNTAEALFLDGLAKEHPAMFRDALDGYKEFLQRFPTHPHAGYALTRLGESLEALGADAKRVLGAYFESYFRYRSYPGAAVARMRILTSRMAEMKDKELTDALKEIDKLAEQSAALPNIKEFVTLMRADGLYSRKDFHTSTDMMIKYFQQNPNSNNLSKFRQRIERNIATQIHDQSQQGQFLEALKTYNTYRTTWLKDSGRFDAEYDVARAFEQAAVYSEAGSRYRETLNRLYSIQGTAREKEKSVFEILPTTQELNLRLARVAYEQKEYQRAADYLKTISNPSTLSEKDQVERVEVAAGVAEAREQRPQAIAHIENLLSTWRGQPAMVAPLYLRLARIQQQEKDLKGAETSISKLLNLHTDTQAVSNDLHAQALELKGDLLMRRGRRGDAVKVYRDLLDQYDGQRPLASVRYRAGKLLFDQGDLKGADTMWANLAKDKSDEVWARLATEQMQSAKWKGEYKKYIDRIPAMAKDQSESGEMSQP